MRTWAVDGPWNIVETAPDFSTGSFCSSVKWSLQRTECSVAFCRARVWCTCFSHLSLRTASLVQTCEKQVVAQNVLFSRTLFCIYPEIHPEIILLPDCSWEWRKPNSKSDAVIWQSQLTDLLKWRSPKIDLKIVVSFGRVCKRCSSFISLSMPTNKAQYHAALEVVRT